MARAMPETKLADANDAMAEFKTSAICLVLTPFGRGSAFA